MLRRAHAFVGGAVLLSATLRAQTFNAASIKRSQPGNPNGSTFEYQRGGALRVRNGTLRGLIESAYDIRDFQIIGGPGWLDTDRFDVLARSESDESQAPRPGDMKTTRLKLQSLLADRFRLVVRHETRDVQEYVLGVDKDGAKLVAEKSATAPSSGIESTCGHMTGTGASMTNLTLYLSRQLRRPVVDATGLTEKYNFQLSWTPELAPCSESSENAPSLVTALREQLGLKLESAKGPVDVVVVDRAERPTED
jgi:bla regulator protein blaR1